MAETAVRLVIDRLVPLLTEEANFLSGVHREVEEIKRELESIVAFLKDADRRADVGGSNIDHGIRLWVKELIEAAFKIEDITDEHAHFAAQQQRQARRRFIGQLRKIACFVIDAKRGHNIAIKIEEIKRTVEGINRRGQTYRLERTTAPANNATYYDPRNDSHFLKEADVVGIESSRDELIARMENESPRLCVISLVGMGGLGKTTLANQIYVHAKGRFDCHAWVETTQTYSKVELLRTLMKKFCQEGEESTPEGINVMDENTVTKKLRDYLRGKRFFVVFDDIWNISFWGDVKNALPDDNQKGGRIVITTRHVEVANFCKISSSVYIHELQPLPREKSWELFCNKAFRYEFEGRCPTHLEKLSHSYVDRCEGLPLAIVVIAGLLSTKSKTVEEWGKLLTSLSSEMESNEHLTSITKILSLSYNDLPYYLKSCFLYFGIFPQDCSIRYRRLIRLWIAEGFVKSKKDKTVDEVAEEYLAELINRSLVQVSELDSDGKAKTCRIHDLLHEIVERKMEELSFCRVLSRIDSTFRGLTRRVSIISSSCNAFEGYTEIAHVRSIFMFDKDDKPNSLVSTILRKFKLLKVLDFEDAPGLDHLPENIGNLFHLRYLSVRGTRVQFLPKSIGKLENLETLDLKQTPIYELPVEIIRLRKLRHLLAYHMTAEWNNLNLGSQRGVKIFKGIGGLKCLQKLYFVEANVVGVDVFKELGELIELRKLGITKLRSEDGRRLCSCIQKMEHLESLDVASINEDEFLDLEFMSDPPKFLRSLYLKGHLKKLPEWIPKLQNIVRIEFFLSKLGDDPLRDLQHLPNLLELLLLNDAYIGEKLHFEEGGFPKLKLLQLHYLTKLKSLVIEDGALCNLEELCIGPCPQLMEVPSGFQHLRNLKLVRFLGMPTHFMFFENFQCLQTVPEVRYHFLTPSEEVLSEALSQQE
ncbi:hypothetical protein TIFTF001_023445 [Ficus carica]|uniref:Uncharacterized protein n=1 Tax=Ficus carica TaxID=3494 RepID=A0AA88AUM3_FICCA|nr:hypothetical protein TIFTF001_023445 [Ficus carica]